ncbi:hypothetical protein J5226_03975 [Lysobacter sp. K5869]|uniref:PEP/pyruvate-binding domain-containing protein n=1 Tax=Lysobacter sp. K5869 TaxID=2820808 RepID=UPI001C0642D3|nr:PEP/pyruvate-binding domain-containing protein [Lysobacter sp. K5869]QWP77576.1 hypothetical protein J5226_03975 [Lysobacter sp. K5869]
MHDLPLLSGAAARDAAQVGHKFARQQRMIEAGLRVPDFFCLPASAFDHALSLARIGLDANEADAEAQCAALAAALRAQPLPDHWQERLLAEFDARFGADALVAVRACVVAADGREDQGEDSAQDPFAGMSDSFLEVGRARLCERVAACWASAYTERAVRYRVWRGLDPRGARVAVGVQAMVRARRAFVAFTRDPRDGARRVVIAAAHGLGEGVVQEKADIDHFFVDAGGVGAELVEKRRMLVRADAAGAAGDDGLAVAEVPAALRAAPVLDDALAREIADLALRVETFFGPPQDVEGAIDADGRVHLVQARPLAAAPRAQPPLYWCNHNITESYPGISGALTFSQAQEFYRRAFGDLYRRMGVPAERFDRHRHHLEQLVGYLNGRVYYRLDAWHALHGQMPVFELVRPLWEDAMGVAGPARDAPRWTRAQAWRALPAALWGRRKHARQVREFLAWWDESMAQAEDLPSRSPLELVAFYRQLWAQVSLRWGVTLTNSLYALFELGTLKFLLARWTQADPSLLAGLLIGGRSNRSLQSVREAVALAERCAAQPQLKAALLDRGGDLAQLWRDLCAQRYGAELARQAQAYLHRYGDRALHDLKLEEATPRQRPWMLLDTLRSYIEQGLSAERLAQDERRAAARAREELRAACPSPFKRAILARLAARMREYFAIREDTRFCRTQLYGLSRDALWRLGDALQRAGRLDRAEDVRDLRVDEVLGAYDGALAGADLRALAALRRREREACAAAAPAEALLATAADRPLAQALEDARPALPAQTPSLRGLGSSAGIARAPAKLVLEPTVGADACRGAILIARETDPGWLLLMMAAKGLVVERGTLLSHTAITGRLLGIPTIVAMPDATRLIPDGALIEIDGAAGTVHLIEDASA